MGYRGIEGTEGSLTCRGELPEKELEMVECPELQGLSYGNGLIPKETCLIRQQEHPDLPMCYGGCKATKKTKPITPSFNLNSERRRQRTAAKKKEVEELYKAGKTLTEVAQIVDRTERYCHNHLISVGLREPVAGTRAGVNINSVRQRVYDAANTNPMITVEDLQQMMPEVKRKATLTDYLRQWRTSYES